MLYSVRKIDFFAIFAIENGDTANARQNENNFSFFSLNRSFVVDLIPYIMRERHLWRCRSFYLIRLQTGIAAEVMTRCR